MNVKNNIWERAVDKLSAFSLFFFPILNFRLFLASFCTVFRRLLDEISESIHFFYCQGQIFRMWCLRLCWLAE